MGSGAVSDGMPGPDLGVSSPPSRGQERPGIGTRTMRPPQSMEDQTDGKPKDREAGAKAADACRRHGVSAANFPD